MKIALVASGLQIYPPQSGGQIRSANLCHALSQLGYQVQVYSFTGRKVDYLKGRKSFVHQQGNIKEFVNMNPVFGIVQALFYKLSLPPFWLTLIARFFVPKSFTKAAAEASLLVLDFPFIYPLGLGFEGPKWLLSHNVEYELWKNRPWLSKVVKKIELEALDSVDKILFSGSTDLQSFSRLKTLNNKAWLIPHGVNGESEKMNAEVRRQWRTQHGISDEHTVFLFTGSTYKPNKLAFDFLVKFCDEHRSALIHNKIVVVVVGTVCENPSDDHHFKVLGKVSAMQPYLQIADFGLNPVTEGSGVNVKMLEYMAAHLPILSTAFGTRGLNLEKQHSFIEIQTNELLENLIFAAKMPLNLREEMWQRALFHNKSQLSMVEALKTSINMKAEKNEQNFV